MITLEKINEIVGELYIELRLAQDRIAELEKALREKQPPQKEQRDRNETAA